MSFFAFIVGTSWIAYGLVLLLRAIERRKRGYHVEGTLINVLAEEIPSRRRISIAFYFIIRLVSEDGNETERRTKVSLLESFWLGNKKKLPVICYNDEVYLAGSTRMFFYGTIILAGIGLVIIASLNVDKV